MNSARVRPSNAEPAVTDVRRRIHRLSKDLTEDECEHLLALFERVESGERPWEQDVALLYNDYVKMRRRNTEDAPALFAAPGPITEDGIFAPVSVSRWFGTVERRQLPPPQTLDQPLGRVVATRRSVSRYSRQPISQEQLSTVLQAGAGVTGAAPGYGYRALPRKTFPSAGGLSSPELYIIPTAVTGLEPGVYHYDARSHAVDVLALGDRRSALVAAAPGQPFIGTAAVTLVMTGCYSRLRWKYGPRAYRYMCMDIGCQAQNVQLAAAALGLGTCLVAGFMEEPFEQ
jgi:SagB-type dehydrogenase family enzyme